MSTAEFDTRLRHPRRVPAEITERPAATAVIAVVVLSTDAELCEAIRIAAANQHPVATVETLEQALDLAAHGRCGILITDQGLGQPALQRISKQMHVHDPATITIAVGSRGDDNALIGLLSSAVVERFMLKPVTPSLARLVLKSAASEYRAMTSRSRNAALREPHVSPPTIDITPAANGKLPDTLPQPPLTHERAAYAPTRVRWPQQPQIVAVSATAHVLNAPDATEFGPPVSYMTWIVGAMAVLIAVAATWWITSQRSPLIDAQQVITANLQSGQAAVAAGNYVEPAQSSAVHYFSTVLTLDAANVQARQGMEQAADYLANAVKQFIVEGRLAEAGIALERLRGISTDQRRVSLLDAQLRAEQASQLLALSSRPPVPLDADPGKAAPPKNESGETAGVPVRKTVTEDASPRVSRVAPAREVAPPATATAISETSRPLPAVATEVNAPEMPAIASVAEPEPTPMPGAAAAAAALVSAAVATPEPVSVTPEPKLIKMIQPEYPGEARMRDIEGWVDVTLSVDAAGRVADARIESSSRRMFNKAALTAVRKWQYEPRTLPSPDSTQLVQVRVTFRLEEE